MKDDKEMLNELVSINKPLLILAGPGMGKTHALAYKMKYLIKEKEVDKDEITVITFTNEASINMRKKISVEGDKIYIEPELQPSAIWTMHKYCHGIIRDYYSELGLNKGFKVLPSQNLKDILIKDCAQIVGEKRKHGEETITCRQEGKCDETLYVKCVICSQYKELMRRFNYIDHDDQISLACKLLKENEYILEKKQRSAKYLLVDEYQDINYAQWELIKLLSKGNTDNLFVVGDDYQSIYSFRGGDPIFIRNFGNDYAPDAVIQPLLISWRCPPNILKGAFHMVQKYNGGDIKILEKFTFKNKSDTKIKLCNFEHHNLEAGFIAWQIREKIGPSYDVLILVPRLSYTEPIKRELRKIFIDFSCEYGLEKTDLYLINILLGWLKDPTNNFNLRILIEEIINRGASDIPALQTEYTGKDVSRQKREDAFKQISNFWKEVGKGHTLYGKIITLKKNKQFAKLVETITSLRKAHELKTDIVSFISETIDKLKIWRNIKSFSEELNSAIEEIKSLAIPSGESIVRILTMKKAKGLQADYVFIVGLENNILPLENASNIHKEEDSRLLYVSMTRAKKELFLLHSETRDRNITKVKIGERSEFIDAIPPQFIEEIR